MATSIQWGSEAVKYQQAADRYQRADSSQLVAGGGNASKGQSYLDSFVPTDRDYSREERAQQQKQLREVMQSIRLERNRHVEE